jgi:hypothetical protein
MPHEVRTLGFDRLGMFLITSYLLLKLTIKIITSFFMTGSSLKHRINARYGHFQNTLFQVTLFRHHMSSYKPVFYIEVIFMAQINRSISRLLQHSASSTALFLVASGKFLSTLTNAKKHVSVFHTHFLLFWDRIIQSILWPGYEENN